MVRAGKAQYWVAGISMCLALTLQGARPIGHRPTLPATAREVTASVHTYDEALPARSPDGHWLAFEYSEIDDPNYPRMAIMDLSQVAHPWHPLLKTIQGRHLFAGDFSWSPDSQWLTVLTDYPEGREHYWSNKLIQVAKVNIRSGEIVKLTSFPQNTRVGPTTAWLRSGLIVFPGPDENIYGVSESGGNARKIVSAPTDKCGGFTNTLTGSPDGKSVAFGMDRGDISQIEQCSALWIGDLQTNSVWRLPTAGVHPMSPFWLDADTILFSGERATDGVPMGLYSVSVKSGKVTRVLEGSYLTPFVYAPDQTLYFSWGPSLRTKNYAGDDWPTINEFYGFHIWQVPLRDVLH